jgi:DNA-binding winged helix-turn-helix (wHTH) protein/tetratricopeptide (TPR) repeat protein
MDRRRLARFSVFELNLDEPALRRAGRRVALQQQPLRALVLLASRAGRVVTRDELRRALWPDGTHVDFERGINFCLNQVRTALRDPARSSHFIETLPRVGYRFVADVRIAAFEEAVPAARSRRPHRFLALAACALGLTATSGDWAPRRSRVVLEIDPQAQQAYLRGLLLLQRPGAAAWDEATRAFETATAREPAFANAQAALARVLLGSSEAGFRPAAEAMPRARTAALAALREDPRQADAWVSLALVRLRYDWDWNAADDLDRALALQPDLARAHRVRAAYLSARGDHDHAIAAAQHAVALDPLCPTLNGDLGWYYYCARRFSEAAVQWRLSVAVQGDGGPRDRLVDALRQMGRPDEAWREAEATMRHAGVPPAAIAELAARGPEAGLRAFLSGSAEYLKDHGASLERLAALHAAGGDDDQALALLERAARERSWGLVGSLAADPDFASLTGRPRYTRLLRETGLVGPEYPRVALLDRPVMAE